MLVYLVNIHDYDDTYVEAVYSSQEKADHHIEVRKKRDKRRKYPTRDNYSWSISIREIDKSDVFDADQEWLNTHPLKPRG